MSKTQEIKDKVKAIKDLEESPVPKDYNEAHRRVSKLRSLKIELANYVISTTKV